MAKLKKVEQLFIVRCLAQFIEPSKVVEQVKEHFKIDVSRQLVEHYDPTKAAGADLRPEFKAEFDRARAEYLAQPIHNIVGANDIVQLQILSDLLLAKKTNVNMVVKLTDQIQKIVKGFYEKKIEITGKDGGPLQSETTTYVTATEEQVRQAINELENEY